MQRSAWTILAITAASIGATTACGVSGDCHVTGTCGQFDGTTSAGASSSTSSSGGDGGGGGAPPACVPSSDNAKVDGSCGIFVSSSRGKDSNRGTQKAPVKTLGHALALAHGDPVYACGEDFDEAVVISSKAILFGAMDCRNGWAYDPSRVTKLTAAHDQIPFTVSDEASIADFSITAVDAHDDSGSSIGILATAAIDLERVTIETGRGHDGANGESQNQVSPGASGKKGTADDACTATSGIIGGDGGSQTCDGMDVSGGSGGNGVTSGTGGPGGNGSPDGGGTFPTDGKGGTGQRLRVLVG